METPKPPVPWVRGITGIPREVWAIAALAVLVRACIAVATGFTNEDFMITLRCVENLAAGHGLVYNIGERVLGTTTPLYALALGLGAKLGLSPVGVGKSLNILADGALCLVVFQWVRSLGWERAAMPAAFFVAVNPLHARWAVSGMETSLVTLVGMTAWLAYTHRRYVACYAVLGLLFLLRWDSLMLTGVLTAAVVWRERRLPWRELLLFALIAAPWVVYATWFYGSPIPVTAASKMAVYAWQHPGPLPQAHKLLTLLFGNPAYLLSTVCAGIGLWSVLRGGRGEARNAAFTHPHPHTFLPPLIWLGVYWVAWLLSKVLLFEWYVVPPLPVWEALAALGAVSVWERLPNRLTRNAQRALGAALVTALGALGLWRTYYLCDANQRVEELVRKPLGLWLQGQSRTGDTVMLEPIGYIGYYSQRRVLDVIGLVSPQVIPYWKPGAEAPLLDLAHAFQPEWVVLRPAELERIQGASRRVGTPWEQDYELLRTWDYLPPDPNRTRVTFHVFKRSSETREP